MRKSSRARKPVDHFLPSASIITQKIVEEEDEDEGEDDPENEVNGSDESEEEIEEKVVKKQSEKMKKTMKVTEKKQVKQSHNILFDAFQNRKILSSTLDRWISVYKDKRIASMTEVLNFLVMVSGGGMRSWIQSTVDIDGLNSEELEEALREAIDHIRKEKTTFLIFGTTQKAQIARDNFRHFWELLTIKLLTLSDRVKVLSSLAELFLSLSTSSVASIRDAATEASLTFGKILLQATVDLRVKEAESNRQLEVSKRGAGAKQKSIVSLNKETQKALRELDEIITAIFTTVFINRSKDIVDMIRSQCLYHLGEWIATDPERWIDEDYLKYIGWMSSDRSHLVRLEALESLLKVVAKSDYVSRLIAFTERFVGRFVELAVGDIEEVISFTAVKVMRKLQICGLLDTVDQATLDLVDRIVFDSESSLRVRAEALSFVMDHTEGFDDGVDDEEDTNKSSSKKKKPRKGKSSQENDEIYLLTKKKKIAIQLETFAEFADHHLHISENGNIEYVSLLAEACLALPTRSIILRDWETIISLLLRDSDSPLGTQDLEYPHLSIILRLFAESTSRLKREFLFQLENEDAEADSDSEILIIWKDLQESLSSSIVRLLNRFRSDEVQLEFVLDILECFEITNLEGKGLQNLINASIELFDTLQSEALSKLGKVLRFWMSQKSPQQKLVMKAIKPVLDQCWSKIADNILTIGSEETLQEEKRKNKRSSQKSRDALQDVLSSSRKISAMWKCIDCRNLISQTVEEISSSAVNFSSTILENLPNSSIDRTLLVAVVENLGHTLFSILLWETRDIYLPLFEEHETADKKEPRDTNDDKEQIKSIVTMRNDLLRMLEDWMDAEEGYSEVHELQSEAFRMIGDLQRLFPRKLETVTAVEKLAWDPSVEIIYKLGKVFDSADSQMREKFEILGESEKDQIEASELSHKFVEKILRPLGSQICDIEHLHKRQAASLITYIVHQNQEVQQFLRAWIKSLKEEDYAKYVAIIIHALLKSYDGNVVPALQQLMVFEKGEEEIEEDETELLNTLNYNVDLTLNLATKLAQTIGVGKVREATEGKIVSFFENGLVHACSDLMKLGLLRILEPFLRLLPARGLKVVRDLFQTQVDNMSDDIKNSIEDHVNIKGHIEEFAFQSLQMFTQHLEKLLTGDKSRRVTISTSTVEEKRKKIGKTVKSAISPLKSLASSRPSRSVKEKGKKSYREESEEDMEEEGEEQNDEEEKEKPQRKRGREKSIVPSREEISPIGPASPIKRSTKTFKSRPSTMSAISALTDDSFDESQLTGGTEFEEENEEFKSPVKKARTNLSLSTPTLHKYPEKQEEQEEEGEEDAEDEEESEQEGPILSNWTKQSKMTSIDLPKSTEIVTGLHLEDFGTGIDSGDFYGNGMDLQSQDDDFNNLPSRRRR